MTKFLLSFLSCLVFSCPIMATNNTTCHYKENWNAGNVQKSIVGPLMLYTTLNMVMKDSSSNKHTGHNENKKSKLPPTRETFMNQHKHGNNLGTNYANSPSNTKAPQKIKSPKKKEGVLKNENQKQTPLKELIEKKREGGEKLTREETLEENRLLKLEKSTAKKLTKMERRAEKKKKRIETREPISNTESFDSRVKSMIRECKTTKNIYQKGVQFLNKEIEGFSKEKSEEVAALFFAEIFKTALEGNDEGNYLGKAAYKLGHLKYDQKRYQEASKLWFIANSQGIDVKKDLEKLKKEKHLPGKRNPQEEIELTLKQIDEEYSQVAKKYEEDGITVSKADREKIKETVLKKHLQNTYGVSSLEELKQTILTKVITRGDTDNFTYEKLKNRKFTDKEIVESLFDHKTLKENDRVAKELRKKLDEKTLPVFIGRSGEWILEHYKRLYPKSSYLHLPGSGLYNINKLDSDQEQIVSERAIKAYKNFLEFKGLGKDCFKKYGVHSLTFIDLTESGDSIFALMTLLHELNPSLKDDMIKVIGIVAKGAGIQFKFPTIEVDHLAIQETIKKHGLSQANALSRSFDPEHWANWETFNFYPEPLSPAKARLGQITNFYDGWD